MKRNFEFTYEELPYEELLPEEKRMVELAVNTSQTKAYAPYSHFSVAAVALLENGEMVCGTNQENASYPCGVCAERVALSAAAVQYDCAVHRLAIAARTPDGKLLGEPITPCGMCRQVILETEKRYDHSISILLCAANKYYRIEKASQLLPFQFDL